MKKLLIAFGLLFLAADSPQAIVKYRQTSMKAMGAHMSAISLVVKHQIASRADLAVHAEAIAGLSRSVGEWFPAGTGPDKVKSGAKAEIWRQMPELKRDAARLERESAKLVELAKKKDTKAFDAQYIVVANTCDDCHDVFRVRD
ncbi:MAG TPA: cytochrome c [Thermoanaerobaculia bacterium]|nr:cytochrome c [Thermoanaerobaculia bacterium]